MFQLLLFLFGVVSGVVTILSVLNFVFYKLQERLRHVVRQREATAIRYLKSLDHSNATPTSKVEAICRMARFDNDIMGKVIPVRAVFFGNIIYVYQIDSSTVTGEFKRTIIEAEHLIGKISTDAVISASTKVSKFHRHTETTLRHAPLRGNCLVLRCKPGLPLFIEDPVVQMSCRQQQQRRQQQEQPKTTSHTQNNNGGYNVDYDSCGREYSALRGSAGRNDKGEFSRWRAVLLKMPTRRELERWFNLLHATQQSVEWLDFIKRIPQADVFNLVVARLFFENTRTSELQDLFVGKLRRKLRKVSNRLPKNIQGEILLEKLELGGEIPLISGVGEPIVSPSGELQFDFDLLYRGGLKLSLRFAITYRGLRMPDIVFNVKVLELSNRMQLSVGPPPTSKMWVGSSRPPQLRLDFTQEIASNEGLLSSFLKLMPDMSAIMSHVVKVMLFEDMVLPSMDDFPLPCLSYSPSSSEVNSPLMGPSATGGSSADDNTQLEYSLAFSVADTHERISPSATGGDTPGLLGDADVGGMASFVFPEESSPTVPPQPSVTEPRRRAQPEKTSRTILNRVQGIWRSQTRGKK